MSKPKPVYVGTLVPPDVHAGLQRAARDDKRSIAALLLLLIEKEVARRAKRKAA